MLNEGSGKFLQSQVVNCMEITNLKLSINYFKQTYQNRKSEYKFIYKSFLLWRIKEAFFLIFACRWKSRKKTYAH